MKPSKEGGKAADWKKSPPIRVVRGSGAKKHSKFAPAQGLRYLVSELSAGRVFVWQ